MNYSEVYRNIRAYRAKFQSNAEFARAVGVSPQYMLDVMRGARNAGKKILDHMGIKQIRAYEYKNSAGKYVAKERKP